MKVQSLSVVVPGGCPNKCRFCVADLHPSPYTNEIENNEKCHDLHRGDYLKRLIFARDNGCNTVMLTGDGEPLMNRNFLDKFAEWNRQLPNPYVWVEVQTSGVTLSSSDRLRWLRNHVGVSIVSLSLSDIFSSDVNQNYNQTPDKLKVDIDNLCSQLKEFSFGLRLSMNMTDVYNNKTPEEIFQRAKDLGADQVTFRVLYSSGDETSTVNEWIHNHKADDSVIRDVNQYIKDHGRKLERLPFGAWRYSVKGMSVVVDDDCMSTAVKDEGDQENPEIVKYLVLQPNCKLYTKWDDEGSLLF